jgi:hypothetical protein
MSYTRHLFSTLSGRRPTFDHAMGWVCDRHPTPSPRDMSALKKPAIVRAAFAYATFW